MSRPCARITAGHEFLTAILAVKQFLTFVNGAPFQPAIAVGLALPDEYFTSTANALREKRDLLSTGLETAGFDVTRPAGSYFVIADAAPLGFTDAAAFCRQLPELAGVVGVPVSAFVRDDRRVEYSSLVRFAYCKRHSVLEDAASRLATLAR